MTRNKLNRQKDLVRRYYNHIGNIRSPLPVVQLAAVKMDVRAIMYIKKPCKAAQMYVVKKDYNMYQYITNPCEDLKQYMLFHIL